MSQDLSPLAKPQEPELLHELRALIHAVRSRVATAVNAELTLLHWRIGKRLLAENLHQGRAEYGQQILASLAQELAAEFGKGFSYSALTRMVRFAELFPDERIVVSLVQVLSWTHILALIPLKDGMAREFYAEMCRVERWSVRTLRQKIGGLLYLSGTVRAFIRRKIQPLFETGRQGLESVLQGPWREILPGAGVNFEI